MVLCGLTTAKLPIENPESSQAASQPASRFLFDMCYDVKLFIRQLAGAFLSDSLREGEFLTEPCNGQQMDVSVFVLSILIIQGPV